MELLLNFGKLDLCKKSSPKVVARKGNPSAAHVLKKLADFIYGCRWYIPMLFSPVALTLLCSLMLWPAFLHVRDEGFILSHFTLFLAIWLVGCAIFYFGFRAIRDLALYR